MGLSAKQIDVLKALQDGTPYRKTNAVLASLERMALIETTTTGAPYFRVTSVKLTLSGQIVLNHLRRVEQCR